MFNSRLICRTACILLGTAATLSASGPDVVVADFEGVDYDGWQATGTAFGQAPAQAPFPQQKPVAGYLGHGFVDSMLGGDRAKGSLTSPTFKIERRYLTFLIGGGGHAGTTCLNLLIDGKVVRTATGPNTQSGGSENLAPGYWEINEWLGQMARLEIVDRESGSWGHINVDQIVQTDTIAQAEGELLYNGIRLPRAWPPVLTDLRNRAVRPIPYLQQPPAVIPIEVGRQLFVDDFLIEHTDLTRVLHHPRRYEGNPILKPETPLELNGGEHPVAALFNDGVWFDPKDQLFKMWYHAGWFDGTGYATSKDGLHWERAALDIVPGTNRVFPVEGHGARDGCAVWLDHAATNPAERFKMFLYERPAEQYGGRVFGSPDGVHWGSGTPTGLVGDNTTIFYNPFRKKWVYSVRTSFDLRTRSYREHDDLFAGAQWKPGELVPWAGADEFDLPEPAVGDRTQLYNLDAIAYESLMLGVFTIHRGPANDVCAKEKRPKLTDLAFAFSRDGFHWQRPEHEAFLAGTRREGDWDRAYLHPSASICTIVGDRLFFYYSGFSGLSPKRGGDIYAGASTGVAFLRRDGFASMEASTQPGTLTTRALTTSGRYLFVNLDAPQGSLKVEALDLSGQPIEPCTLANCTAVTGDSTHQRVSWNGGDLASLEGWPFKLRFHLTEGRLYAFWISPEETGASHGYVAAGGPGFEGAIDTHGN